MNIKARLAYELPTTDFSGNHPAKKGHNQVFNPPFLCDDLVDMHRKHMKLRGAITALMPPFIIMVIAISLSIGQLKWPIAIDLCAVYMAWRLDNHTGSFLILAVYFNIIFAILFFLVVALALSGASH